MSAAFARGNPLDMDRVAARVGGPLFAFRASGQGVSIFNLGRYWEDEHEEAI